MLAEFNNLPESLQMYLSQEAFRRAACTITQQADALAKELATGRLPDRGGAAALQMLTDIMRLITPDADAGAVSRA